MKNVLVLLLAGILVVPSGFAASALLRLERAPSPTGIWEEVPANTLPITAEGAFLDNNESAAAFYRMKIEDASSEFPELNIPLGEVPVAAKSYAQGLLESMRYLDDDNGWEEAELGPIVFPIYDPVVGPDEPAYLEFKVQFPDPRPPGPLAAPTSGESSTLLAGNTPDPYGSPGAMKSYNGVLSFSAEPTWDSTTPIHRDLNQGFILVSLTKDDDPILEYATVTLTKTERLRWLARSSGAKMFRYGDSLLAAENEKGELIAYIGVPPVYFPDEILEYCNQEFEGVESPDGGQHPDPLPFEGKPYDSYQQFKDDWLHSNRFQLARERRRQDASILWDIYTGALDKTAIAVALGTETHLFPDEEVKSFTLADPRLASVEILRLGVLVVGKTVGTTTYQVLFADGTSRDGHFAVAEKVEPLSPDQPTGWSSWSYYYAGNWGQQRRYTQEPGGSCYSGCGPTAWAMLYGWFDYTGAATNLIAGAAPLYNNNAVRDCIWYIVPRVGVYCVGNQGATNPWNMYKGYQWAASRGHAYYVSYTWSVPCFYSSGARNKARDSIRNDGRPTIIGIGCTSPHYPVAYGYKYREYRWLGITWDTERKFKCNMGWGGSSPQWKNGKVWYGQRNNFY